ncbi:GIY-YIG nuclease family protein [Okeania sp. SIO2B3]|uniref:GIY-YIG nuclease family protein n=1 Tax=Okeania sp. SIO2B3 TaxID=2607784 RepID=UPI0013C1859C|nr:GIY-YIG nuclease family protein [Okeania sp. SIO2B3]NET45972.1 GIY-YIG nuclease family protein [Okeania sp. SIO2B3]
MWLKYGVSSSNDLISINEVNSGKTNLTCLYCGGKLTAKKGRTKRHHFAHTEETCKPVLSRHKYKSFPGLPLYDRFNIQLPGAEVEELKILWKEYQNQGLLIPRDLVNLRWILKGLMQSVSTNECQFTDLGKIPMGALSLQLFNEVQEPLLLAELNKFEQAAQRAELASYSNLWEYQADLKMYRAMLKRILLNSLYFLQIKTAQKTFYKIGITTRPIEQRIAEVQQDLNKHFSHPIVNLLGLWEHRGNVELYFKHKYKDYNYRIGKLTEYFDIPDIKLILNDLFEMRTKVLTEKEQSLCLRY